MVNSNYLSAYFILNLSTVLLLTAASQPQDEFHCALGALDCQFKTFGKTEPEEETFGIHALS